MEDENIEVLFWYFNKSNKHLAVLLLCKQNKNASKSFERKNRNFFEGFKRK